MKKVDAPVAVCSRSFSQHRFLRTIMEEYFTTIRFNSEGLKLSGAELVDFLKGQQGAIVALEPITEAVLKDLPDLKIISKFGVGLDGLDLEAMKAQEVALGWTGGVNRRAVAELTLGYMLGLARGLFEYRRAMASGVWQHVGGFEISGKTIGIVGCGNIGKEVIELLQPFGCRILVNDLPDSPHAEEIKAFCQSKGASLVSFQELFKESDIVSLHIPYEKKNHLLVNQEILSLMKPSAVLVNTSRGKIVDEEALLKALQGKRLAGAGMDVYAEEPATESPLLSLPQFAGTPHIGGTSQEGTLAMGHAAIENLYQYFVQRGA